MTSRLTALAVFTVVAACGGQVPDSNPNAGGGVGFGNYDLYQAERAARDRALERSVAASASEERVIASETIGVLNATRQPGTTLASAEQPPAASEAPVVVTSPIQVAATENAGISDEQSFEAVSTRETIQSDKERLQRLRQTRQEVQPEAIPTRPGDNGPNIVAFALSTENGVGQAVYRRSGTVSNTAFQRACARFTTSDQAQEAFLKSGGPKTDRRGLDPDGDGFACYWDPTPFRAARGG